MNKHMPPPMKMKVERGRLVPATSYDAERLDSYRVGSTVSVRFTADRMRPVERKYRAILGKVIKECKTPWSNAEAAHQALKLACGYVNVGRTMSGEFMQWPRSLVDFDDKEMEDYFESVLSLLHSMTGVDPETLRNETADVADDEPHNPETGELSPNEASDAAPSPAASDEGGAAPSPSEVSPNEPAGASPVSTPAGSEPDMFGKFNYGPKELVYLNEFLDKGVKEASKPDDVASKASKMKFIEMMFLDYSDPEIIFTPDGKKALAGIRRGLDLAIEGSRDIDRIETWATTEFLTEVNGNG